MQIKLIIWDLDDTLWHGTLADGDDVVLNERRAELVCAFNARGVVSSICSNNDAAAAEERLRALGLWDQFVFPQIAFAPKPEAIRQIIADMQLRPANVLFVDDNPHVLAGAKHVLPELNTLDALSPGADDMLQELLAGQPEAARSRIEDYRMLERKAVDRTASAASHEAFLHQCEIRATSAFLMDNLDFAERIAEMVNRSNQLNYTSSRLELAELKNLIMAVATTHTWSIFAWDRYGDYGLVGFVVVDSRNGRLEHFVFSCRAMHMGLESFALAKIAEQWDSCDLSILDGRVVPQYTPWIQDLSFHEPAVRDRLHAQFRPEALGEKDIRVMFDCQSGAITHFSRHRKRIEFDNNPRLFALRHMIPGSDEHPLFTPNLIYGAGVDYSDWRWPGLEDLVDDGLFEACVELLCTRIAEEGQRLIVMLPAEDMPEALYRPDVRHTRERTMKFNAIWREHAAPHDLIEIFELTGFARPTDMTDISHYHPDFLGRLAGIIDRWIAAGEQGRDLPLIRPNLAPGSPQQARFD
ncbi:MAG: hypothetical protein JF595_03220 [Sphingomonadales bacterium]|nr:hypothetical protein [Sphingomonadales bacterium]